MNTFKKMALALAVVFSVGTAFAQQDRMVEFSQIPANAQKFVKTYFSQEAVASVWEDSELLSRKEYTVHLNDGTEIDFYANGDWEEIKSYSGTIPAKVIPARITEYIKKTYPNEFIKSIKKERYGFEVELSSDLDLKFNKKGKFLRIDY